MSVKQPWNRHRIQYLCLGVTLALAALAAAALWHTTRPAIRIATPQRKAWPPQSPQELEVMFGGAAGFETIAKPERVEAYRIRPPPSERDIKAITDYSIIAGPVRLTPQTASELSEALTSPKSYVWESAKACMPEYGVCFTFLRGGNRVDVLVCFECDILLVALNGSTAGGEDFDPVRAVLVRAAKASFPVDDVIGRLPDQQ